MVLMLARIMGIGIETADMLVHEALARNLRDRRALARYGGMTGAPDESGSKRREKGLARAGNARVRRGMIQLAWRWLMFQKDSALAHWFQARTTSARGDIRNSHPRERMGPPPRSLAADAHDCIMVGPDRIHRIQGCGASATNWQAPLRSPCAELPRRAECQNG